MSETEQTTPRIDSYGSKREFYRRASNRLLAEYRENSGGKSPVPFTATITARRNYLRRWSANIMSITALLSGSIGGFARASGRTAASRERNQGKCMGDMLLYVMIISKNSLLLCCSVERAFAGMH